MATVTSYVPAAEGANSWTDPTYARNDDGVQLATCAPARNGSVAGIWQTFGIAAPAGGGNITKVRIGIQAKESANNTYCSVSGQASYDGGTNWTADTTIITAANLTTTSLDTTFWIDITSTGWTWSKLDDTHLQVRIYGKKGATNTAYTISMYVVFVEVTYESPVVTDALLLTDAVTAKKEKVVTDSSSLSETIRAGKGLKLTDASSLGETVRAGKGLKITDTSSLADAICRHKIIPLSDAVALAEAILSGKALYIADVVALSDNVSLSQAIITVDNAVVVYDAIHITCMDF